MKYPDGQKFYLTLRHHNTRLDCQSVLADRTPLGKVVKWDVGERGSWPRTFFIPFSCELINTCNELRSNTKTFANLLRPIRHGLRKGSVMIGTTVERKDDHKTRLLLRGVQFADFVSLYFPHSCEDFLKLPNKRGQRKRDLQRLAKA